MIADRRIEEPEDGPVCRWAYLGILGYQEAWEFQRALVEERTQGKGPDSLLLLEHPPTYTLGRRGRESDLLLPRRELERQGAAVYDVDRGGEVTYHGPGQLVGYPIVDLRGWGGPLRYVRALEAVLVKTLSDFGVQAGRIEGLTGVWAEEKKIAAIGVRISRGVTSHGFALNVSTDLSWFRHIIPCGIHGSEVTSLEYLIGHSAPLKEVAEVVVERFGQEMGFVMTGVTAQEVRSLGGGTPEAKRAATVSD